MTNLVVYINRHGHAETGELVANGRELQTRLGRTILPHGAILRDATPEEAAEFVAACASVRAGLARWYNERPHVCD